MSSQGDAIPLSRAAETRHAAPALGGRVTAARARPALPREQGRRRPGWLGWETAALLGVATALLLTGLRHEPWFDEAQAWLIARDDSLWDIVTVRMHHEGTPPLWHLLLAGPAKLGMPYRTISVISGIASLVSAWLLLFRSPFPAWLRATLPFTYFLLYQYGVVARSYCLVAPLLFWAACSFQDRRTHPWRVAVPLLVLAQVSVHGAIVALCWGAWLAWELRREWDDEDRGERLMRRRALVALGIGVLLATAQAWPSPDTSGGGSWSLQYTLLWQLLIAWPLNLVIALTVGAAYATLPLMRRRGVAGLFLMPAGALCLFFLVRYWSPWHGGVLVLAWIAALWVAWQRPEAVRPALSEGERHRYRIAVQTAVGAAVVVAGQLAWSALGVVYDVREPYSGSQALAAYVRANNLEHRISAEGKWIVSMLPYFDGVVIANYNGGQGPAFYPWSKNHDPMPSRSAVEWSGAPLIVVSVKRRDPGWITCPVGYREVAIFPGHVYVADRPYESETYVLFRLVAPGVSVCDYVAV